MPLDSPPFAPPYITRIKSEQGMECIETLADGTTRPMPSSKVNWFEAPSEAAHAPALGNTPAKTYLNVPFAEKDAAKALGAKWDAAKKKWYVPAGLGEEQFGRWL